MDDVPNFRGMSERVRGIFEQVGTEDKPRTADIIGRICPDHGRWVACFQHTDPCYLHVWGKS